MVNGHPRGVNVHALDGRTLWAFGAELHPVLEQVSREQECVCEYEGHCSASIARGLKTKHVFGPVVPRVHGLHARERCTDCCQGPTAYTGAHAKRPVGRRS